MMLRKIEQWTNKNWIYHPFIVIIFVEYLLCGGRQKEYREEQGKDLSFKNSLIKIRSSLKCINGNKERELRVRIFSVWGRGDTGL